MATAVAAGSLRLLKASIFKEVQATLQGKNRVGFRLGRRLSLAAKPSSPSSLGLKPLRAVTSRATATETAPSEFPRPGTVAYDQSLANSIHLIGSVGVNPDIKYLDSGRIVATSSLSVKKTAQGEPTWFFLEFQSDLAEIAAQHIRKGDRVHVAGRVVVEKVVEDDVPQVLVKVDVTEVHFVDDTYGAKATAVKNPQTVIHRGTASATPSKLPGTREEKKQAAEKTWNLFYSNPSEWYDNRDNKRNPKAPDFKHRSTGEALWIEGFYNPPDVVEKIQELESKGLLKKVEVPSAATTEAIKSSSSTEGAFEF